MTSYSNGIAKSAKSKKKIEFLTPTVRKTLSSLYNLRENKYPLAETLCCNHPRNRSHRNTLPTFRRKLNRFLRKVRSYEVTGAHSSNPNIARPRLSMYKLHRRFAMHSRCVRDAFTMQRTRSYAVLKTYNRVSILRRPSTSNFPQIHWDYGYVAFFGVTAASSSPVHPLRRGGVSSETPAR